MSEERLTLLITTLHGDEDKYLHRTAISVPYEAAEIAGIYDVYSPDARAWLILLLPYDERGHGIVYVDEINNVVYHPEIQ